MPIRLGVNGSQRISARESNSLMQVILLPRDDNEVGLSVRARPRGEDVGCISSHFLGLNEVWPSACDVLQYVACCISPTREHI
jgi:hypothetical protein